MFGLIIMAFEDAVKEGDGQRVYDLYKLLLLIYKSNKHRKYAFVTLHYLVRIAAFLPEFDAERLSGIGWLTCMVRKPVISLLI